MKRNLLPPLLALVLVLGLVQVVLAATDFFQGFEINNDGWNVLAGQYEATRVASGTNGVTSKTGSFHAEAGQFDLDTDGGSAFTRWGGYETVFPTGGYTTSVDIYLDVSGISTNDTRFDWTSAINNSSGNHRRDFVFNAGGYTDAGNYFVVSASTNAGRSSSFPKNPSKDPVTITTSGWYTFRHRFYDNGGVLAVNMSIIDSTNSTIHTWTLSDPSDLMSGIGGHRYGWFASNEFPFLAFDNSELISAPPPPPPCTTDCYVDAVNGNDANGGASPGDAKKTIQAAIDQVSPGGTVHVYPGNYSETASGRTLFDGNGPHQFGLFISEDKDGITIQGVNGSGNPITDYNNVQANVETNATNNFGYSGIFVEGDNVTITGLHILPNVPDDNKTIEVIGDNFTLKHSHLDIPNGGSVYFDDWRFDSGTDTSHIQKYRIENNWLDHGTSIDLTSGAGYSGLVNDRIIKDNKFTFDPGDFWPAIGFTGSGTGVPWFVYSVGGAIIEGNDFSGGEQYIRARGDYDNNQFDWASYWNDNDFDKAAIVGPNPPADVREFSYTSGPYTFNHVRRIGAIIQGEVDHGLPGDTVLVKAGTYPENVVLDYQLTLQGAGSSAAGTIIDPPAGNGITITSGGASAVDRLVVKDLRVTGSTGDGIQIQGNSSFITFDNIASINNTGNGIGINSTGDISDIEVIDSNLSNNTNTGFRIATSVNTFNGLTMTGGQINDNGFNGLSTGPSGSEGVTNINVSGTSFSGNGSSGGAGSGDVSLFLFNGDASFSNVMITGNAGAHIGFQLRGSNTLAPAGTVILDNVDISGSYQHPVTWFGSGLFIANYSDVSGISFSDVDIDTDPVSAAKPVANLYTDGLTGVLDINDTSLAGNATTDILNITLANFLVDATGATFTGAANNFVIEDRVLHRIDFQATTSIGLVLWEPNNVFVTINSFAPPDTTSPSIQRGVNAASSGFTVNVGPGTFNNPAVINKSNLTVLGQGIDITTVQGTVNCLTSGGSSGGLSLSGGLSDITIADLTVTGFDDGIQMFTGPLTNILIEDVEASSNCRHGIWSQAFGINGLTVRRVDASLNNSVGPQRFGRGLWVINGVKQNITVEDGTFNNNRLVGIDISDGNVTGLIITGNEVIGNGDSGIAALGMQGPEANLIDDNTVTNNGRFGIEIKNSAGNGASSGPGSIVVSNNTVSRNVPATDPRDHAGIAVIKRLSGIPAVDNLLPPGHPTGVVVSDNEVSGYLRAPSAPANQDGFGIVVEGTNQTVSNNTVTGNDVGIQAQAGGDGNQGSGANGLPATPHFGRGNASPTSVEITDNTITNNSHGIRSIGPVTGNVTGNFIHDNTANGLTVLDEASTGILVNGNDICRNINFGMQNLGSSTVDATTNWWGATNGPGPVGPGSGDNVSNLVDFSSFTTTPPSSGPCKPALTIIKEVVGPAVASDWAFSGTDPINNFTIPAAGGQQAFALPAGEYTVSETPHPDYTVSVSCSNNAGGTDSVAVTVDEDDEITCTFTNSRKTGTLTVVKDLNPNDDPGQFNLLIDGQTEATNVGDGGTTGAVVVNTGNHTVTEEGGDNTNLADYTSSLSCVDAQDQQVASEGGNVTVNEDDEITCTFTNSRKTGTLTVVKDLEPDDDPGQFNLLIDGQTEATNVGDGGTTGAVVVNTGSHTVAETAGDNTNLTHYNSNIVCRAEGGQGATVAQGSGTSLELTVNENDDILCTITNTFNPGSITIIKEANPESGQTFAFTSTIPGSEAFILVDDGDGSGQNALTIPGVAPGSYTLAETVPPNKWTLLSINCVSNSTSRNPNPFFVSYPATQITITDLAAGENVTCTFYNEKPNLEEDNSHTLYLPLITK